MKSKQLALIVVIVIAIAFTGFNLGMAIHTTFTKEQYVLDRNDGWNDEWERYANLRGNHSYKIHVSVEDEDNYEANVQATLLVYLDGEMVESAVLSDTDFAGTDDYAEASDEEVIWLYPDNDCLLQVQFEMNRGDTWLYLLYEDLPENLEAQELAYGTSGILGLAVTAILAGVYLEYFSDFSLRDKLSRK